MKTLSHRFISFLSLVLVFTANLQAQSAQDLPEEVIAYADLVFYNGKILTADEQFTIVEAVAIRDGKFLASGGNARIRAMAGPQTRRVDLEGRSVVPGFMDTHLHSAWVTRPPGTGGSDGVEINYETLESALEGLRARVQAAQPGEVQKSLRKVQRRHDIGIGAARLDNPRPANEKRRSQRLLIYPSLVEPAVLA